MLNPAQIHAAIEQVSNDLESLVSELAKAGDAAAHAEADYKAEFAKQRLKVRDAAQHQSRRITVDEVTDWATERTRELQLEHLLSKNNYETLRSALRARQSRLDALRTLATSIRVAGG